MVYLGSIGCPLPSDLIFITSVAEALSHDVTPFLTFSIPETPFSDSIGWDDWETGSRLVLDCKGQISVAQYFRMLDVEDALYPMVQVGFSCDKGLHDSVVYGWFL